uniref:Uncharacterized protein n=1 Tax=Anguilla anguilla TaxID=7936 RepID=A0A0E9TGC4_ANGAN
MHHFGCSGCQKYLSLETLFKGTYLSRWHI